MTESREAQGRRMLAALAFATVAELAARWRVDASTVTAVPFDQLPWVNLARSGRKQLRRYDPEAVRAFEARGGIVREVAA